MYESIPSLIKPPSDPRDSHALIAPGVGFSPNFLCPAVRCFELEKFPTDLKEKCRNFSICFKETGGSLKRQVFLCCFISIFAKTVEPTVSLITYTNSVILIKLSGPARVIFVYARSSLKFRVSYVVRFIVNIQFASRLFPRVFLIYGQSRKP